MSFWTKASNWNKIKDTVQGMAAVLQIILVADDAKPIYNVITAVVQLVVLFVGIWGADANKNNIPDFLEEDPIVVTTTTTIKKDEPVTTETTVEKKE